MPRKNKARTPALPDWYPRSTYEHELTDGEWVSAVAARFGFQCVLGNIERGDLTDLSLEELAIRFASYLTDVRTSMEDSPVRPPNTIFPVANMNRFKVAYLAHLAAPHSTKEELKWAERLAKEPRKWLAEYSVKRDQFRTHSEENGALGEQNIDESPDVLGFSLPLLVNVNLDDETLKACFSVWLAGIRQSLYPAPKPITSRDFAHWKNFGVLPGFDLQFWNRLTGAGYTDAFIAQTIWPDSALKGDNFVDRSERYRKVTKPLIAKLFTTMEVTRLLNQFELVRSVMSAVKDDQ